MRKHVFAAVAAVSALILLAPAAATSDSGIEFRSLDGGGNNTANANWGQAGTPYSRGPAGTNYADSVGSMLDVPLLPSARAISNRIFNAFGTDILSENNLSQMGWVWGQFIDHTLDLRDETPGAAAPIPFLPNPADKLESFNNDFGFLDFSRTPAARGTGTDPSNPRQQINTVNSFIDAWNVYGGTAARLDWLRAGPLDGDPTNNSASLLLPGGYLPLETARGNVANSPSMDLMGALTGNSANAIVAGDVRANENSALTAIQTVFAREHNRIVSLLPADLPEQLKFDIARRVVGAEEQYITYREFLPAMGVNLAPYTGYNDTVDPSISNEFATVGFRAHSQINGEIGMQVPSGTYSDAQLATFKREGIDVDLSDPSIQHLIIPLDLTFGNPGLLREVGIGRLLQGLAGQKGYNNDEQIDNQLRSILFEVPKDFSNPIPCFSTPDPNCFSGVVDLGAIDVQRGRDHGMPTYNQMRAEYGLRQATTFTDITGEPSGSFPAGMDANDPASLAFTQLRDAAGNSIPLDDNEHGVADLRGSPIAARLSALYGGDVNNVDAFVGMVSERHIPGSELGPLQYAIWKRQFEALRDGDRFFYRNDSFLTTIRRSYGIDFRQTLAQVIENNTDSTVQANVFKAPIEPGADSVGLVASYSFDEGSGSIVNDSSGRGNNGKTWATNWVPGKYGSALSFNGAWSSVTVPGSGTLDLTHGATLEAWVKPSALGAAWRTVVFKEQSGGMDYSLYADQGTGVPLGQVSVDGSERNVTGSGSLPLNTWSYLAATYDGVTQTLYVNGNPVASTPLSGTATVSEGNLKIGGNSIWTEWFKGAIDEVRVYNRALSQADIQTDMGTPISALPVGRLNPPGLVGDTHVEFDSNPVNVGGIAEAFPATAGANGTVQYVHVYMDAATTIGTLIAGVYSDDGGHPGSLLATGSLDGPRVNAWNSVAVPALPVAAGTTYWIAVLGQDGLIQYRDRCCTTSSPIPTETEADRSLTELPAVWQTGNVYDDGPISAYATN